MISAAEVRAYQELMKRINSRAAENVARWLRVNAAVFAQDPELATRMLNAYMTELVANYGAAECAAIDEYLSELCQAAGTVYEPQQMPSPKPTYGDVEHAVNTYVTPTRQDLDGLRDAAQAIATMGIRRVANRHAVRSATANGMQFAWKPIGDTCAFCITLASRGWQDTHREEYARHVHPNCDCVMIFRRPGERVDGYDPSSYLEEYENAPGETSQDRINAMRRQRYADGYGETARRQHRERYAEIRDSQDD